MNTRMKLMAIAEPMVGDAISATFMVDDAMDNGILTQPESEWPSIMASTIGSCPHPSLRRYVGVD